MRLRAIRMTSGYSDNKRLPRAVWRSFILVCAGCLLTWLALARAADLHEIKDLLNEACFQKAQFGVHAVDIPSGAVWLDIRGDTLLIPASTAKLITSAAAALRLSLHYRFRTAFLTVAPVQDGVILGDLFLKGYGDPGLVLEEAWLLVRGLRKQGIHTVRGDLVGDDSFFDAESRGQAWGDVRSQRAFNARIGALSVHFNSVTIEARPGRQVGDAVAIEVEPTAPHIILRNTAKTTHQGQKPTLSVTRLEMDRQDILAVDGLLPLGGTSAIVHRNISDPTRHATLVIRELLAREGVRIEGDTRLGPTPPAARSLYVHQSKPLYRVLDDLNKFSNNFIAEQILKTLGAESYGPPGSWTKGLAVVANVLEEFGIEPGTYQLTDGSGLSRQNRFSPIQIVTVLARMAQDFRLQPEFMASLRTPDVEGWRGTRFQHSEFARRVRVKTGSLDDVSALAGYVGRDDGGLVAFAVLMNGPFCSLERAWQVQETIVERLLAER